MSDPGRPVNKRLPEDGQLTSLNSCRLILDTVGAGSLREITAHCLDTAGFIFEANGDYALARCSSGWCRMLHTASRKLCNTPDTLAALRSGKWICHESCWTGAAKKSIETGKAIDKECQGGMRRYAVPVTAHGKTIGSISTAYGSPPKGKKKLEKIASRFQVDVGKLASLAGEYTRRSSQIVAAAKSQLTLAARLIGQIVEQKQTEKAARDNQTIFRSFLENSPVYIFFKDHHIRSLMLSRNYEQMLGRPLENILGKSMAEIFPSDLARAMVEDDKRILREGKNVTVVEEFAGKTYETTKFPIRFDDRPDMLAGFTLDVTERRKTETSLRKSEEILRAITNTAEDSIFCKDADRKYTFVNRSMTRLLGCRAKDLLGKRPEELFDPESAATIREVDDRTFSGERVSEIRPLTVAGTQHYFHTIQVPMRVEDGTVISINGIVRDVTDRVQAQQEKETLEAQLRQSRKLESLGTLAGGIAHDFNNILTVILGYTELAISEAPAASALSKDLGKVLQAGARARDLVQQILTFSRQAQTARVAVKPQPIIEEALKMLRPSMPQSISIQENIAEECGTIEVDPTQFYRVLMNICTNAIHAMEKNGGTLKVALQIAAELPRELREMNPDPEKKFIQLSIGDTGTGIDPDIIDQIFDPFFTTKEKEKGSGMGLAITYGLIKEYGGTITVDSQLGNGAVFHINLPQSDEKTAEAAWENEEASAGTERILFVDDEELLAEMSVAPLARLGYRVTYAKKSDEALAIFQKRPNDFDLVITDLMMPGLTGIELVGRMLAIRPDLPIILCTGYSNAVSHETAKEAGIRELVFKPVSKNGLARLIRKVLDGRAEGAP